VTAVTPGADLTAGHDQRITPRLVVPGQAGPLDLAAERRLGTYRRAVLDVLTELGDAGLVGRGGAAFPAHVKWRAVADREGPKVVVANGEEGEPASAKDRWLLTHRPHLVLDGLLLAAESVGASRAIVYLSHPDSARSVRRAVDELRGQGGVPHGLSLEVFMVAPAYVAGEETAVVRALNGGPAKPTAKPPRPFEAGVDGRPTLVSNVETLAHAAWISRHGAAGYRRFGTVDSPGTTLMTLGGACARPGVYEVPFGLTVRELFEVAGGLTSAPSGFVMGGWFGGILPPEHLDLTCSHAEVRAAGSGLGCGSITALEAGVDPLRVAAEIASWYADESAQQCGVCIKGTVAIRDTVAQVAAGGGGADLTDRLARWGDQLPGRGACAFLDGAATMARSVVTLTSAAADGSHTIDLLKEKAS
jgi:NADH:ubiquinone oxidoreductase subunit F (NADH-binding)